MAGGAAPGGRGGGDRARGRAELGHLPAQHHGSQRARAPPARRSRSPAAEVLGGALSAVALAGFVDEIQNGPRVLRRAVGASRRPSTSSPGSATPRPRTLVVLAHHDAAQTGFMFDQTAVAAFHERFPQVIPNIKTQPPQWWGALAGPVAGIAAALSGRRAPARAGIAIGARQRRRPGRRGGSRWSRAPTTTSRRSAASSLSPRCSATARSRTASVAGLGGRRGDAPGRDPRVHGEAPLELPGSPSS